MKEIAFQLTTIFRRHSNTTSSLDSSTFKWIIRGENSRAVTADYHDKFSFFFHLDIGVTQRLCIKYNIMKPPNQPTMSLLLIFLLWSHVWLSDSEKLNSQLLIGPHVNI